MNNFGRALDTAYMTGSRPRGRKVAKTQEDCAREGTDVRYVVEYRREDSEKWFGAGDPYGCAEHGEAIATAESKLLDATPGTSGRARVVETRVVEVTTTSRITETWSRS